MSDFTPRANLRLPGGGSTGTILPDEQVDIDVLNDNFRKVDALLGARNIPSASSYSGSMDGDLIYARDTKMLYVNDAGGGGLVTPRLPGSRLFAGTLAQRDAATYIEEGDHWQLTGGEDIEYVRVSGAWKIARFTKTAMKTSGSHTVTSAITIPDLSLSFTLDAPTSLHVEISINGYSANADTVAQVGIQASLNGGADTLRTPFSIRAVSTAVSTYQAWRLGTYLPFVAGSHTLTLRIVRSYGTGSYIFAASAIEPVVLSVRV